MNGNELVTVMSVKQKASWQAFCNYFQTIASRQALKGEEFRHLKNNVVRALDSLAFCDFDFPEVTGGYVYSCEPSLVRLPSTSAPEFILVGARTAKSVSEFLTALESFGLEPSITEQPFPLVPARICIAGDFEVVKHVCDEQKISVSTQPPSWTVLSFACELKDYISQCSFTQLLESEAESEDFDPQSLKFSGNKSQRQNTGAFRLTTYYGEYGRPRHLLWKQDQCAVVDRDWGRYAVLWDHHRSVMWYDAATKRLLVPLLTPLPRLYSRAMALCSGLAPSVIPPLPGQQVSFQEFQNVPQVFADILARKLGQALQFIRGEHERSN